MNTHLYHEELQEFFSRHGGAHRALTMLSIGYIFDELSSKAFNLLVRGLLAADARRPCAVGGWITAVCEAIEGKIAK